MQEYTTNNAGAVRRNAERATHRAQGETTDADEVLPPLPTLEADYDPFTPEQRETITAYTERSLSSLQQSSTCNHNNASGFETWGRLHLTYDQGEKEQQLNVLAAIISESPETYVEQRITITRRIYSTVSELERRDLQLRIYSTDRNRTSMKMALLMQHIQGDIRSHLLQTEDLARPNFEDAAKKVEEYYRNVYADNNNGGVNGMKGIKSTTKVKERRRKAKESTTTTTQAKEKNIRVTTRSIRKGSQKESTHHDPTTSKEKAKATKATHATTIDPKGATATMAEDEAKEKDQMANHPTTTFRRFRHYHHKTKAKVQHNQRNG
eukprot:2799001-Amphidinium_carterae.2